MNNEIDWRNVFIILIGFILGIFAFFIFMFAINGWFLGFLILFLCLALFCGYRLYKAIQEDKFLFYRQKESNVRQQIQESEYWQHVIELNFKYAKLLKDVQTINLPYQSNQNRKDTLDSIVIQFVLHPKRIESYDVPRSKLYKNYCQELQSLPITYYFVPKKHLNDFYNYLFKCMIEENIINDIKASISANGYVYTHAELNQAWNDVIVSIVNKSQQTKNFNQKMNDAMTNVNNVHSVEKYIELNSLKQYQYFNFAKQIGEYTNNNIIDFKNISDKLKENNNIKNTLMQIFNESEKQLNFHSNEIINNFCITKYKNYIKNKYYNLCSLVDKNEFLLTIYISYTSPAGRNHYDMSRTFTIDECLKICAQQPQHPTHQQCSNYTFAQRQRNMMTQSLRFDVLKRDNYKCRICGRSARDGVQLEVDHIKPVSQGGKTEMSNLQTLCKDCNRGKGTKSMN